MSQKKGKKKKISVLPEASGSESEWLPDDPGPSTSKTKFPDSEFEHANPSPPITRSSAKESKEVKKYPKAPWEWETSGEEELRKLEEEEHYLRSGSVPFGMGTSKTARQRRNRRLRREREAAAAIERASDSETEAIEAEKELIAQGKSKIYRQPAVVIENLDPDFDTKALRNIGTYREQQFARRTNLVKTVERRKRIEPSLEEVEVSQDHSGKTAVQQSSLETKETGTSSASKRQKTSQTTANLEIFKFRSVQSSSSSEDIPPSLSRPGPSTGYPSSSGGPTEGQLAQPGPSTGYPSSSSGPPGGQESVLPTRKEIAHVKLSPLSKNIRKSKKQTVEKKIENLSQKKGSRKMRLRRLFNRLRRELSVGNELYGIVNVEEGRFALTEHGNRPTADHDLHDAWEKRPDEEHKAEFKKLYDKNAPIWTLKSLKRPGEIPVKQINLASTSKPDDYDDVLTQHKRYNAASPEECRELTELTWYRAHKWIRTAQNNARVYLSKQQEAKVHLINKESQLETVWRRFADIVRKFGLMHMDTEGKVLRGPDEGDRGLFLYFGNMESEAIVFNMKVFNSHLIPDKIVNFHTQLPEYVLNLIRDPEVILIGSAVARDLGKLKMLAPGKTIDIKDLIITLRALGILGGEAPAEDYDQREKYLRQTGSGYWSYLLFGVTFKCAHRSGGRMKKCPENVKPDALDKLIRDYGIQELYDEYHKRFPEKGGWPTPRQERSTQVVYNWKISGLSRIQRRYIYQENRTMFGAVLLAMMRYIEARQYTNKGETWWECIKRFARAFATASWSSPVYDLDVKNQMELTEISKNVELSEQPTVQEKLLEFCRGRYATLRPRIDEDGFQTWDDELVWIEPVDIPRANMEDLLFSVTYSTVEWWKPDHFRIVVSAEEIRDDIILPLHWNMTLSFQTRCRWCGSKFHGLESCPPRRVQSMNFHLRNMTEEEDKPEVTEIGTPDYPFLKVVCDYPLCNKKHSDHAKLTCPTLHNKCTKCYKRGHRYEQCDTELYEWFDETFREHAPAGLFTRLWAEGRRHNEGNPHLGWGFADTTAIEINQCTILEYNFESTLRHPIQVVALGTDLDPALLAFYFLSAVREYVRE